MTLEALSILSENPFFDTFCIPPEMQSKVLQVTQPFFTLQQSSSVFASLDPNRVTNMMNYLMGFVEVAQCADQFYVAFSKKDVEGLQNAIEALALLPETSLRNLLLSSMLEEVAGEGHIGLVHYMLETFGDIVQLDADTLFDALETCISRGDEEAALLLLGQLDPAIDFSCEADDLVQWALEGRDDMPRLTAALQDLIDNK
jgi:hypothetical protein